jgi:hypothetical protein
MRNPAHRPEGQADMPFSDTQGKDVALDWYRQIEPATVVDIGAGCGTYAQLMRPAHAGRWTAIEAWEPYASRFDLVDHYDEIRIADARDLGSPAFDADLVIAGDVLEHMAYADARGLIARIKQTAHNVIVSIPVLHLDQGDVFGNPYERHIDHWTADAMRNELGPGVVAEWVGNVLAYFWWRKP